MRLLVYNTEGKIFAKLSLHLKTNQRVPRIKVPAREQFTTQAVVLLLLSVQNKKECL